MKSNSKIPQSFPSETSFTPDSPHIWNPDAYPGPPNSPRGDDSDTYTAKEGLGQTICTSAAVSSADTSSLIDSPVPVTRLSAPEAYRSNGAVLLEQSALKTLLGIEDWLCGGLTQKRTPCKRLIANKLHDRIDLHISSMIGLRPSSPQLLLDLEKLIDLVHCYQHRRGYVKQMRLESWMEAFPSGPDHAAYGTSIQRKIELCFGRVDTQCIGTTGENKRCNKSIGGQKAQNCIKTIEKISQVEVYLHDVRLDYFLRLLAVNRLCHLHTKQSSLEELKSWKEKIGDVLERASLVSSRLKLVDTKDDPQQQISINGSPANIPIKERDILSSTGLDKSPMPLPMTVCSVETLVTYWPDQYDTTPFDIVERSDGPEDHRASYKGVRRLMEKRLSADDRKNGYIYVYEVEGNKGFVKIGYTTRSITKRHKEWCFDCNRVLKPLFPIPATEAALVPNAHRVEKLCHAELRHRQAIIYCRGCLKTHEEWFELSLTEAIAVVEKWSAWMKKGPYHPGRLSLKQEEARKASDMDSYMDALLKGD